MRTASRLVLAFVLVFGMAVVLPRPASNLLTSDANAQILGPLPTPTLPDLGLSPSPLLPPGGGGGDDDDGGSGGGGTKPGSGGGGKAGSGGGSKGDSVGDKVDKKKNNNNRKNKKNRKKDAVALFDGTYVPPGRSFSTDRLVSAAAELRSLGVPIDEVNRRVYPPFIIAGQAAWQNTWGAPRSGPGPIVRKHEGQDVFCKYGDPVLAPEAGRVSYSDGGLGGTTARVHVSADEYWYLTHLSETNELVYPMGSQVQAGDVVGFCGKSGNALTTPPHVHFGWYVNGSAKNPHRTLVRWLQEAEEGVSTFVARTQTKRLEQIDRLTLARRFGDTFTPGVAQLQVAGESFWASGSSPTSGALALAEAALQAALARNAGEVPGVASDVRINQPGAGPNGTVTADRLNALLRHASFHGDEHNHD